MEFKGVEISKIVVSLGGKEVDMTLDQARQLYKVLDDVFSEKKSLHQQPVYTPRTFEWPNYPNWTVTGSSFKVSL